MKGQIVTLDFITALFVFITLFSGIVVSWNYLSSGINEDQLVNDMRQTSSVSMTYMISSRGYPLNWNSTSVEYVGLSTGARNHLDSDKISELIEVDYNESRELLRIPFDFYIEWLEVSGDHFDIDGSPAVYGLEPDGDRTIVLTQRYVLVDGQEGIMRMRVWT